METLKSRVGEGDDATHRKINRSQVALATCAGSGMELATVGGRIQTRRDEVMAAVQGA